MDKTKPSISICMATLNAAKILDECLTSVYTQNYPPENIEIIVGDGGSTDETRPILERYNAKIYENTLKTAEAGKAVAVKFAKNDLILILDSDNILPHKEWLNEMVKPFTDKEILIAEPLKYTWRKNGGFIERYSALIGMNDPLCLFIGNYDRWNYLTLKWTNLSYIEIQKENYLKIKLVKGPLPTIGANGVIFRTQFIKDSDIQDYLFDIDIIAKEINKKNEMWIAKVNEGIIHTYCENDIFKFIRKQRRRITDYFYFKKANQRDFIWYGEGVPKSYYFNYLKFIVYTLLFYPLLFQSIKGYIRKKDVAWFFHPFACAITLWVYGTQTIRNLIKPVKINRDNWKQ